MRPLRSGLRFLALFAALSGTAMTIWLLGTASAQAAPSTPSTSATSAPTHTLPAANDVLTTPPTQLVVVPAQAATSGTATVRNSTGAEVTTGALTSLGDSGLGLRLPALGNGVYLVSWTAGDQAGSFAFDVAGTNSPQTVVQPKPSTPLGSLSDNLIEWIPLTAIMIFVGALALRFLVSAPAARRSGDPDALASTDRRITLVAAAAIAVFVPTTVMEMAFDDGKFDFGSIWPSLGADGDGHVLGARLALTLIAAVVIIPLAIRRRRPPVALLAVGLGCGLLELAGREVPTAVPPDWPRTIFNTFLYVAHLWAAALWIGGLAALLSLAMLKAVPAEARRAFWPSAIRRFSTCAMVSVAAIVLSGLWLYWVHIDGVNQLVTTMYGRTLLVKLIVVAVLVLIGAANQFWLMPRIEAQQTAGDVGALNHTVGRHFRATIAVEVVLGLAVLFIAPLLGGSARNQAFQASPAALTQTEKAGDVQVALTPSGLQPGSIDYTIQVAGDAAPHQVTVSFGSTQLKVPPQAVVATALGGNKFRVTGFYTPVIGKWQAAVSLDNAAPASFTLPITAKPGKLPKSAAPDVRWTTWVFGIAETLLVVLVLISTSRISRMLSNRRPPSQPPATEPERDLVDA